MPDKNKRTKQIIMDWVSEGVFDAFEDVISIHDTDFKVLYQNQGHKNMVSRHIGEYCYKVYQSRDNVCENCQLAIAFKDGKVHTREQVRTTDDGTFFFKITSSPLKDSTGKIIAGLEVVKDITKRKRAEKALATSSEKYRLLVDSLQEGIWALDAEEKTTFVNNRMAEMLGYTVEEMLGKKVFDFMDERGVKLCKEKVEARKAGVKEQHDFELIKKDGSVLYVLMEASPIKDEDGNYIGGMAAVIDITERKRADNEVWESRSTLKQILDTVPQSIFWKDRDSVYLGCNKVFAIATGINDPEKIIGKTDFDLPWPREEAEAYRMDDREVITTGRAKRHIVEPLQQADGSRLWIDTTKVPLEDKQGRVYGVLGVYDDITERKKTEQKLSASEEQYRILFNKNPMPMWIYDAETFYFLDVNEAAIIHYRYSRDDFLSMTIKDIRPVADVPDLLRALSNITSGPSMSGIWRHKKKNGSIITVEIFSHGITYLNRPARLVLSNDVTELKKAEYDLKKYRDYLEKLVKERTNELELQKITLEQKNIALREIIGQIELEKNKIKENILGNIEELVIPILRQAKVKGSGDKLIELIEQNLRKVTSSFGVRLSSKKLKLTPREVDVCNMVEKGITNKEMSDLLSISIQSIEGYRKNIRKKLGLANKKVNLISYLRNLR
ncbi:MAG: PAS domain S-box protein [Nitrospirae bacterium]|nr:PAS domain S-box protein [Nitrospirota bacterium]